MLDKKCVKTLGRTAWIDDTLWMAHSGSGMETMFYGKKAVVTMLGDSTASEDTDNGDTDNQARFAIYLNDTLVADCMMDQKQKEIVVLDAPEEKQCVLRIIKLTESAMSTIGIKDIQITCQGKPEPTPDKPYYIEFVGDSITCGYGVEDEDPEHHFVTATENVTKAYAYKTAKALDSDYSMVSLSGYGIISGYTETGESKVTDQVLPDYYDKLGFSHGSYMGMKPTDVAWDFSGRQPDLVVLNLGTNDDSYTLDHSDRQEEYARAYTEFIKVLRKSNPNAMLLCVLGIMGDRLYPYVEKAVSVYKAETGDNNIRTMKFDVQKEEDGYVADWHPTAVTHDKAAAKLVDMIKGIMRC